ncbi:hypothetical protein UCREL1_8063 [Eutypa lata UCREL1]|uniref:Uncharacterized protein n=1 Tax=Eutypa lata (strain UCR-EL1) TaxID=1287681 RepID=M7SKU4_EUTLA|nr:hypothetical protein UCREL1_8063 [Eutypa lata UCREL1]
MTTQSPVQTAPLLSHGTIIAITAAAAGGICVLAFLLWALLRRAKTRRETKAQEFGERLRNGTLKRSNETRGESANNEDDEDGSGSGGGGGVGGGNHDNDDGGCRIEDNEEVPMRDDERIPYKYELSNENRILQFEESTEWAEGGPESRAETERPEMLAAQGDVEQEERARRIFEGIEKARERAGVYD